MTMLSLGFIIGFPELVVVTVQWVVPIIVLVWLVRATLRNKRENTRLRLEVGKLADEMERARRQPAGRTSGGPAQDSA